jgi:hypothetical protein
MRNAFVMLKQRGQIPNYQQVSRKLGLFMERTFDCFIDWAWQG